MLDGPALPTGQSTTARKSSSNARTASRCTVLAYANPFHDETGNLVGAVNVLVDITDRKRAEEDAACARPTAARDEFLAMLAHELRNPLAPIRNGGANPAH